MLKNLLKTIIILDLIFILVWGVFAYKVSRPFNFPEEKKVVSIEKGSGLQQVATQLREENIISDTTFFTVYALVNKKSNAIKAGTYTIKPDMDIRRTVDLFVAGEQGNFARVTFPEGFNSGQIAERLVEKEVLKTESEFLNIANISTKSASDIFDHEFLREVSADSLEGFLFPDTYDFELDTDPVKVTNKILSAFNRKAWPVLEGEKLKRVSEYTPYELLIISALIEKEVQSEEDMRLVSGILYNRLEINMPLQIDATLAYITGKSTEELGNADKVIDSPFNTYQNLGLPPAPIANPGLQAISAALNPTPSEYLYYLTGRDGTTHFAKTLEGHNENKRMYLR